MVLKLKTLTLILSLYIWQLRMGKIKWLTKATYVVSYNKPLTLKLVFNSIHLLYQYNYHDAYSIKDRNYVCLELKKNNPQSQPQSILTISESWELEAQVFCFFLCAPQIMVMVQSNFFALHYLCGAPHWTIKASGIIIPIF